MQSYFPRTALITSKSDPTLIAVGGTFTVNSTSANSTVNVNLANDKRLVFSPTAGGGNVYFIQQNDDNFVFYSTNTINEPRAIWSVYANSTTSNLNINVRLAPVAGLVANGSLGSAGQVLTTNSTGIYWSTVSGSAVNPAGADTQVQFNDGGSAFGATAGFTFNKTTNNATIGNTVTVGTTATVNGSLANLQALNVVNQTNTGTLFVTTSANVASAFLANSTGAYHSGIGRFGGTTNRIVLGTGVGTSEAGLWVTANTTVTTIQAENQGVSYLPVSINPNGGAVRLAGTFGTTNGVNVTNVSIVVGNSVANATLSNNVIQIANSTSTANLTPTTLAIGSITVNSALANLQALNVVNQTNTGTLFVTTSANVGTNVQITPNSLRLGNSTSNIVITNTAVTHLSNVGFTPQLIVRNSTSDAFGPYWNTGKSRSGGAVQTGDDIGTFMFQGHDGTDFRNSAYIVSEIEGTVSTNIVPSRMDFFTTNTSGNLLNRLTIHANGNINVNNGILTMGGGVGTTNGTTITNTSIAVGNSTINTSANSTAILVNGRDLVATQKRSIAMSLVFGR
jgi:hypothetical protein